MHAAQLKCDACGAYDTCGPMGTAKESRSSAKARGWTTGTEPVRGTPRRLTIDRCPDCVVKT